MRKSAKVALGILATAAIGACSDNNSDTAEAQRACVDNRNNTVVSRDWCTPGHPSYLPVYAWYYGGSMVMRGNRNYMQGGSLTAPSRSSRSFGRSSPTVSRGVIGGKSTGSVGG